jgi:hypothetical protein
MKITIYELLGLIKDGKQPKYISIDGAKLFWNGKTYQFETEYCTLSWDCYIEDKQLNYEIEIIEEVEDKLIPDHISNEFIQSLDKEMIKHIAHKVNEIINYLQYISKEDK